MPRHPLRDGDGGFFTASFKATAAEITLVARPTNAHTKELAVSGDPTEALVDRIASDQCERSLVQAEA